MFLCSLVGVIVISIMVVAVTNKLEMNSLQSKAYTVMRKVSMKEKMKDEAAKVIGKATRLYLNIKSSKAIKVQEVFSLNRRIMKFKNTRR